MEKIKHKNAQIMRETLIYLAHLDHEDTEQQMLTKLSKQLNGEDWSWNNLNTLCWAIGSISGSMVEEQVVLKFIYFAGHRIISFCMWNCEAKVMNCNFFCDGKNTQVTLIVVSLTYCNYNTIMCVKQYLYEV
ncbi:hypothetical protein QJS10_CPA06g01318 [Acorus calamus]|uniref:Uncharacterized protein n=1 Tax=Acorus calamus TaxID=4465 RepID=A0AAV9ELM2_ACOCL|nr:hypothetical protein QJS10_CPA06g01318 [Acorus calamus]